jgi:NitT/TauT family transport system permease protein
MRPARRERASSFEGVQVAIERERSVGRRIARRVVPPLIVVAAAIGIWYLVSYYGLSKDQRFLLPPPHQVFKEGFLDWHNFHEILVAMEATTKVAVFAFILSSLIGIFFAILMSEADWIERSFFPFAVALQTLPFLAIVPLVGFWFGFNETARITVATIVSLFPIITNALFGLKSTEPAHRDLFRLHRAGRLEQLWRLKLPGALPSIFSGLRISAGLCVIASIVTDFFIQAGNPGIGLLLEQYASQLESERLFSALAMTALLGIVVYLIISAVALRVVGKWHSSYRTPQADE